MRKIDHTPAFDNIDSIIGAGRRAKIAVVTLFSAVLILMTMVGVIYGMTTENDSIVTIHLFALPIVIAVTLVSFVRISHRSVAQRQRLYLKLTQELLVSTFDLELDLTQVKQLGFGEDWRAVRPGVTLGSTGTLSDFPKTAGRYHSIVAVKLDETAVGLFETQGETVIEQLQ